MVTSEAGADLTTAEAGADAAANADTPEAADDVSTAEAGADVSTSETGADVSTADAGADVSTDDFVQIDIDKWQCNICAAVCSRRSYIIRHITSKHLRERPFQCAYCPKRFSLKQYLKEHEYTQTG